MPPKSSTKCDHSQLTFSYSSHASTVGYKRATPSQRIAAATSQVLKPAVTATHKIEEEERASIFPAPLVLPEDELAWDPTHPTQNLSSWIRGKHRNKVTPERRTIYFTGPPDIEPGLEYIQEWAQPRQKSRLKGKPVPFPETNDVRDYLEAFYHGLAVKMLPLPNPCFTAGVEGEVVEPAPTVKDKKKGKTRLNSEAASPTLWLNTQKSSEAIGIRTRATPKGEFSHQLNLNDLLDAAIEILPDDAYALLMLVEHDIFEDDDDDFACGRAYGGSRIAVVSGARYNPILDATQRVDRDHAWPASHCAAFMQSYCEVAEDVDDEGDRMSGVEVSANNDLTLTKNVADSPMYAARAAHVSLPSLNRAPSSAALYGLWLGRVCRTGSHELGHCFGIAHCVYYACAMQGTASIIEDSRQPPYLCPVDLAKILTATAADVTDRYRTLIAFCDRFRESQLFAAYGSWMRRRLEMMSEELAS